MQYYVLLAVQGYCLYHMYKNNKPYYWYFLIFVPVIGPIIYFILNIYNKQDAERIQTGLTAIINPTKRITDLEKQLEFSDSYTNRIALADAYVDNNDFPNAIINYK